MADDTWSTLALPALEEIANQERKGNRPGNADVAEAIGAARDALNREMENLVVSQYVEGTDVTGMTSRVSEYINLHLLERGKRAVGEWPSEDPYADLVALLEHRIAKEENPERRSRLQRFLDGVIEAGKDVAAAVLTEVVKRQMGL